METGWLLPQRKVWFKQDQSYTAGTVVDRSDNKKQVEVLVLNHNKKLHIPFSKCYQRSNDRIDYEDMCNMNILNEPEILENLRQRYVINKIYTKIGPTLIALNPYKSIDSLYQKQVLNTYKELVKKQQISDDAIPHVYLIASAAYCNLKSKEKKQAIVISGESGAGKTENTKYCMKFLTSLSHSHQKYQKEKAIQDIILECNPILQAFGNSKTVRNSNSSRFGKYVRLFINPNEQITGARVQNYLLQKSRVTSVSKKQRTFHIFYYLIQSDRQQAGLVAGQKYQYLQSSGCMHAQGIDDKSSYKILKGALENVGLDKKELTNIWLSLGAILLLGNLDFDDKQNSQSENNLCKYTDQKVAERICKNLGLTISDLNSLVLQQKHTIGKDVMIKKYNKNQCIVSKNTLAKALYSRIFDYLIERINEKLWINKKDDRSISILDIFGFQLFDKNSLEQLCINFTNQRLQQLYTKYVFDNELSQLRKDGLADKIKDLVPPDNKSIIELIQKRMGISVFSMIDQKTTLGAAKDEDIVAQLRKIKHKSLYVDPQPNKTLFMILHTQNPVVYTIIGFKHKNQDSITPQVQKLNNKLFPIAESQQFKGKTLVTKFDKQLKSLNEQLQSSQLHFIRCIKPNEDKKPNFIDDRYVIQQIKYLGVLETIQIRKMAYPFRTNFNHFIQSYKDFIPCDKAFTKLSLAEQCLIILKKMIPGIQKQKNSFLLGKQKIYLKEIIQNKLNIIALQSFKKRNNAANKIQKQFIRYLQRQKLLREVRNFVVKIKLLEKLLNNKLKKTKIKHFKEYHRRVIKIREQEIRRNKKEKQIQEQIKRKASLQEQFVKTKSSKSIEKQESIIINNLQTHNHNDYDKKYYQTALYDTVQTVQNELPPDSPTRPLKKKSTQIKDSTLSQSYLNYQSVLSEDPNTLIKGELRIPIFQKDEARLKKLNSIITHTQSNLPFEDPNFDIIPSADDKTSIDPSLLKGEIGHKIINFEFMAFFQKVLKKRKTLFGRKKGILETLTAKDSPIGKSLLNLSPDQQLKALEIFNLLVQISDSHKTQKIYQPIQKIVQLMQNTSQMLKNQVFVQLIKQQNVKNEYSGIKMYQIMAIFIHVFYIDEPYVLAYLACLLERHDDSSTYLKIRQYICYIFPRVLRLLTMKQIPIFYMPVQFQLAALMCKRQVPVSVYFSIGNSVIVKVQSFELLGDIKERVLKLSGINSKRILPDMVGFFEVMSFDNEELEENPLDDTKNIWDLLTYWEKAKNKFQQTSVKPPEFGLYFKIKFAFEVTLDDEEGISLMYAQTYFDLFLGRLKIPFPKLLQCSAMMITIQPLLDIDFILPIWAIQDNRSKQQYFNTIIKLALKYKDMSINQIHFQFLRNCSHSPLIMTVVFPTQGNTRLYMKPKRLFIVENDEILQEIGIRRVLRWGCDDSTLMLTIKDNNSQRVMTIKSQFAKTIGAYLSTSMKLIMALKSN